MDKYWKQITPSDYAWEREALEFAKAKLPDHEPYRAWANLRLAAAASEQAALSSRAEFYPRDMEVAQALELAQGALLGSRALTVQEIQDRVKGRYPAAKPLPGRPHLDELVQSLDMGFAWDPN